MKKLYTLLLMAAAGTTSAFAQWNTGATPKLLLGLEYTDRYTGEAKTGGDYYVSNLQVVRTADKKTWLAWKSSIRIPHGDGFVYGEDTFLQLLDRDGNALFDEPILVNEHMTPSWWSTYSLCLAADGSAIVTVSDSRAEEADVVLDPDRAATTGQAFQPAIYKIDQDGNFLWGLDGITYPQFQSSAFTYAQVVGDDTFFIMLPTDGDGAGTYIQRISDDGTTAWNEPRLLDAECSTQYQILPTTDGELLLFHHSADGANVTRYDRDLNEVWETVTYDDYKYDGYEMKHYRIVPDGSGGAVVGFVRNMGNFAHNIRVQHINADGSLGFGLTGMDAYNADMYDHNYVAIAANPETEEILAQFCSAIGEAGGSIMHQKFSYDGDYLYDEPAVSIANKTNPGSGYLFDATTQAVGSLKDGSWIIVYADLASYNKESIIIRRYDKDGKRTWTRTIGRELGVSGFNAVVEDEAIYLFWRETQDNKEPGLKMFRMSVDGYYKVEYPDDVTDGIADIQTAATAATAVYSLDGKQLQQPRKGLNIVRQADGTVVKMRN